MFKKILYTCLLSVLSLTTACTDWLDVKPVSQIVLDDYWTSEEDVQAVLASCYRNLTTDDVIHRMIVWGELRSDNMTFGGGVPHKHFDIYHVLAGNLNPSNVFAGWGSFYTVINYCNTVLYYAPFVVSRDENFTQDDLNQVRAEALAIRSMCYFYLVRAFKEVPWIEDASIDDTQNYSVPKSSEAEIMNRIIADLLIAKQYARTDYGQTSYNKGRITRNAVNALLADVYLWDQQYEKSVEACNEILADNQLRLVRQDNMFSSVFYIGNSTESIFELQFKENVQVNNPVREFYGHSGNTMGYVSFPISLMYDAYSNPKLVGQYSPFFYNSTESKDDIRNKMFVNIALAKLTGQYYVFKYAGIAMSESIDGTPTTYRYRTNTANWILYRLSDIMLMKAEALVQVGESNYDEAISLVNTTYLRSNDGADSLKISNYSTKGELEDLILRERQRELMFEGKRWFDLVRRARRDNSTAQVNKYIANKTTESGAPISISSLNGLYMPIWDWEIRNNLNLKQNPFYEVSTSTSK
jgi:starch-binding outer membrane protein, SusD/RagB family